MRNCSILVFANKQDLVRLGLHYILHSDLCAFYDFHRLQGHSGHLSISIPKCNAEKRRFNSRDRRSFRTDDHDRKEMACAGIYCNKV